MNPDFLEIEKCLRPPEMKVKTSGSLDLSGKLPLVMLEEPVRGSRAWGASDLTSEDWTIQLNEDALEEIHIIAETIGNHPLTDILRGPEDFEIPHLKKVAFSTKSILDQGCGFCVMEPFPLDSLDDQEQVECFRIFSQLLGRPVAQKCDGTIMYDVTDTGQPIS